LNGEAGVIVVREGEERLMAWGSENITNFIAVSVRVHRS
jgi:hypothetical protein